MNSKTGGYMSSVATAIPTSHAPNHLWRFRSFLRRAKWSATQLTNQAESQKTSFPLYGPIPALSVIDFEKLALMSL